MFAHLVETLTNALAAGRIGTPVAVRLFVHASDAADDLTGRAADLLPLLRTVFGSDPWRVAARMDGGRRQLSVLLSGEGGQTASITLACGGRAGPALDLLVIGNHGVIRLEDAPAACGFADPQWFDGQTPGLESRNDAARAWQRAIEASAREGRTVTIDS